jgi:hypothetical protein
MIVLIGLMDVHSFEDSTRGLFILARGPQGEFRFPVTEEQAAILLSQFEGASASEDELPDEFDPATVTPSRVARLNPERTAFTAVEPDEDEGDDGEPPPLRIASRFRIGAQAADDFSVGADDL